MMNRVPAEELLTVIHTSHAELRAEAGPRRESSGDLDVRWRLPQLPAFRDLRRPAHESGRSSLAPGF
jgi:hypothetical protein